MIGVECDSTGGTRGVWGSGGKGDNGAVTGTEREWCCRRKC